MIRIVLIGGMAVLGREQIERDLQCDYRLSLVRDTADADGWRDEIAAADVVVGWPITADIVEAAASAKLLQAAGAGVEQIPFQRLRPGVAVANTFHHETSIAEHMVMAMLVLARRPEEYDQRLRKGNWWDSCIWGEAPNLEVIAGKTVLIIGLGHIGRAVAQRTSAFGMRNTGVSRDPAENVPDIDLRVGFDRWEEQLAAADFVAPCCPLTEETEGLIGAAQFARMKSSAYLINTARGRIVEERSLYEALRDRVIAGAAIDVWYRYPAGPCEACPPSEYPFEKLDNILMTPHVSGWTKRTVDGRMRDIAENINRLAAGEELLNVVHRS